MAFRPNLFLLPPPPFVRETILDPEDLEFDVEVEPETLRAPPSPAVIEATNRLTFLAREAEREARRLKMAEDLAAMRQDVFNIAGSLGRLLKHFELVLGEKLPPPPGGPS
jgi:hypothetical protein